MKPKHTILVQKERDHNARILKVVHEALVEKVDRPPQDFKTFIKNLFNRLTQKGASND